MDVHDFNSETLYAPGITHKARLEPADTVNSNGNEIPSLIFEFQEAALHADKISRANIRKTKL